MSKESKEVRVQLLEQNNFNNGKLYRLKRNWSLYLQLSNSILHKNVRVFCNMPKTNGNGNKTEFDRNKYYEYEWVLPENCMKNDDFNRFIEIECSRAGSFNYYFTYDNQTEKKDSKGGSNFLVDPELTFSSGERICLNSLQIQTVLTKLLGPLNEWKSRLQVSKETGYNVIHFTPVQDLSLESNSSYCISDHLKLMKSANADCKYDMNSMADLIHSLYTEWNMFSLCDLVYNHMANDAPFLRECPQASYNMENSPHLIPAFVLDRIIYHVNLNLCNGVYESRGIKKAKIEPHNLDALKHILRYEEIPKYNLEEYFMIDLNKVLSKIREIGLVELNHIEHNLPKFKSLPTNSNNFHKRKEDSWKKLTIVQDPMYKRLASTIDYDLAREILRIELEQLNLNEDLYNSASNTHLMMNTYDRFRDELNRMNHEIKNTIQNYLDEAVSNVISTVSYFFFASDGPKWNEVTKLQPISRSYFYFPFADDSVRNDEQRAFDKQSSVRIQAHNGWVMGDDPLRNFASKERTVYFRRQLIPWGDSVKLRYGDKPADNPELWAYMAKYTEQTARIFHGVRLDNCHSTPIHVAQYFLDIARSIRSDLYIIAELFTNSEDIDNKFCTELGITALIRESMTAWNSVELGRLVHRFGGEPVGSFYQSSVRPLQPSVAHAIFYDITHDNPSIIEKHNAYDALASSSLVFMSGCAVGSTRGFDELVPHHINVVTENRPYSVWEQEKINSTSLASGINRAKLWMNKTHLELGLRGFWQLYVDQFDADTIVVTRHNPKTHESLILAARTSFSNPSHFTNNNLTRPVVIPSKINKVLFEACLEKVNKQSYVRSEEYLNGLDEYKLKCQENINGNESNFIDRIDYDGNVSTVHFKYFPPGAIILFDIVLNETSSCNLPALREYICELMNSCLDNQRKTTEIESILNSLSFDELNVVLYRCSDEESSENIDSSAYDVPKYGRLTYCGLQGFMNILERERLNNNLGHPFFENLRQGDWMMNYTVDRLKKYYLIKPECRTTLNFLALWLEKIFSLLSQLPRYLIPSYFDLIITGLYTKVVERCWFLMSIENNNNNSTTSKKLIEEKFNVFYGSSFLKSLSITSITLTGFLKNALLPESIVDKTNTELLLSLSAGLPFFSSTFMRNWARDTFISLRGLLLLTNRRDDAKNLILTYGSCLRHGLIPNLLGEGKAARYNARDAVWWWLKSICEYCDLYGADILKSTVYRLYPTDDSQYPSDLVNSKNKQSLHDIVQEALTTHLNGLKFRERNAGPSIDDHMSSEGFNNEIGVDLETGFVFGGNAYNCGTWMDKMGSSDKAGNRGVPATPRDGSAVELVGISRYVLDCLIKLNSRSEYPFDGAVLKSGRKVTWQEWANKIDLNFEKHFWIDANSTQSSHINKRNIYKDTHNSSIPWTDYQLRPNFLIALTLAPQMFNKEHAQLALDQCKAFLMNDPKSIGIKTLDESDYNYFGYYDNSNDSSDKKVSHGFNYHNGPEWLWPVGFYLRSLVYYNKHDPIKLNEAMSLVKTHLGKLNECLNSNDWKGLPELTNKNGEVCIYSCSIQAWSMATIIELFYDLATLSS